MTDIYEILVKMQAMVNNPQQALKEYKISTGKAVIGCFPYYTPEEIVHAAGMLPVGMWGGETRISQAHTFLPAFACPIMQANMEFALQGVYKDLDAVIIPAPCDTLKSIGQDWKYAVPDVKAIICVYPQMRKIEGGIEYLKSEFAHVKKEIEVISGKLISDEALVHSIGVYNEHRKTMRRFVEVAAQYPKTITPKLRHAVIKSGYFMEKGRHTDLVKELIDELEKKPAENWKGKKVILTGILAEPDGLLDLLAENKLAIAGDDLAQETRQFRTDVPDGGDPLLRMAKQWALFEGCSMAYDPEKKRGGMLIDLARKTGADGIIFCMMKFCDPEEFDYPIIAKEMEQAGIPLLYVDVDQQTQSLEQSRTRIQGFAEMLNSRN